MMQTTIQISDAALIEAYQQGEQSAIEKLILRHKDRIYTAVFLLVKDRSLADDLFQDTFLKIIHTINEARYAEQGKFLAWALRVAHNLCMDHFRKTQKQIPITTADGEDILALLAPADASMPVSKLEQTQTQQTVHQLIQQLPEEQREVMVMRIYGDLSFKEIADATGVGINTALGRMRYALLNIRKAMKENQIVLR